MKVVSRIAESWTGVPTEYSAGVVSAAALSV